MNDTQRLVYELIAQIPQGKVMTYGQIASLLKLKTPRQVGWILHRNVEPEVYPCHRVVFADGSLSRGYAFGGWAVQMQKLQEEGVPFDGNKVDIGNAKWTEAERPALN